MEVGGLDGVVTSRLFWEFACQSGGVLVRFGYVWMILGGGHDKKVVCLGGFGFLTVTFDLEFSPI